MPLPKILLLGKNGQVGAALQRALAPLGEVVALDRSSQQQPPTRFGALCGDLADLDGLRATVNAVRPAVIVNAAAYTAVDRAESDTALARRINAAAPAVLAQTAAEHGAWLVHYSTDYVFDGSGTRAWCETDATGPLNAYGQTKLEGEQALAVAGARYLNFRTSWVYAAAGANFLNTMLRLAQERQTLSVVDDQWGVPTSADWLARVTAQVLAQVLGATPALPLAPTNPPTYTGTYHVVPTGEVTWHGYACHLLARAQQRQPAAFKVQQVQPVPTSAFPTPAPRPANSRLATTKFAHTFGLRLPPWQEDVDRLIDQRFGIQTP